MNKTQADHGPEIIFQKFSCNFSPLFIRRALALFSTESNFGISRNSDDFYAFYSPLSDDDSKIVTPCLKFDEVGFDCFSSISSDVSLSNSECHIPFSIQCFNSINEFNNFNKESLLKSIVDKIHEDIRSGLATKKPNLLNQSILHLYTDVHTKSIKIWTGFPSLSIENHQFLHMDDPKKITEFFSTVEISLLQKNMRNFKERSLEHRNSPFFVVVNKTSIFSLSEFEDMNSDASDGEKIMLYRDKIEDIYVGFLDSSNHEYQPGWNLQNFIAFVGLRWHVFNVKVLCLRIEKDENLSMTSSKVMNILINDASISTQMKKDSNNMDFASCKCLLVGAGTLGCCIARGLISKGVMKITFIDNGRVSYSNPVRQSLYTFEDCLNGGTLKAIAAPNGLRKIILNVNTDGYNIHIPMPGHPLHTEQEIVTARKDVELLNKLISEHDAIFVLTDTRESRWLPTVLCTANNKLLINVALGMDVYLVQHHGNSKKNGCYFCSDVVAPENSQRNRTLDQQCTVTRPGLAYLASSLAVEIMGSTLTSLGGERDPPNPSVPGQIRGNIGLFTQSASQLDPFDFCTGCCDSVIHQWNTFGFDFVHKVCNDSTYLDKISGLEDFRRKHDNIYLDIDWDDDDK